MKHSIHSVFGKFVGAVLVLAVVAALPTGWLYDLWAGTGTGQGQRPGEGVEPLRRQEDVERFFLSRTPATVPAGNWRPVPWPVCGMWDRRAFIPAAGMAEGGAYMSPST